jgi:hypothetical protein
MAAAPGRDCASPAPAPATASPDREAHRARKADSQPDAVPSHSSSLTIVTLEAITIVNVVDSGGDAGVGEPRARGAVRMIRRASGAARPLRRPARHASPAGPWSPRPALPYTGGIDHCVETVLLSLIALALLLPRMGVARSIARGSDDDPTERAVHLPLGHFGPSAACASRRSTCRPCSRRSGRASREGTCDMPRPTGRSRRSSGIRLSASSGSRSPATWLRPSRSEHR